MDQTSRSGDIGAQPGPDNSSSTAPINPQLAASQAVGTHLLKMLAGAADEANVPMYLDAGTLLGAARQRGWIPWDDDIDVIMFRSDYEVLRRYLDDHPAPGAELMDPLYGTGSTVVPRFGWIDSFVERDDQPFGRQPERDRICADVFLLDVGPSREVLVRPWLLVTRAAQVAIAVRNIPWARLRRQRPTGWRGAAVLLARGYAQTLSEEQWKSAYRWIATLFSGSQSKVAFALNHLASQRGRPLQRDWFADDHLEFENVLYRAPKVPEYLAALYGPDFLTPPPESERVGHPVLKLWARLEGVSWESPVESDSPHTTNP